MYFRIFSEQRNWMRHLYFQIHECHHKKYQLNNPAAKFVPSAFFRQVEYRNYINDIPDKSSCFAQNIYPQKYINQQMEKFPLFSSCGEKSESRNQRKIKEHRMTCRNNRFPQLSFTETRIKKQHNPKDKNDNKRQFHFIFFPGCPAWCCSSKLSSRFISSVLSQDK